MPSDLENQADRKPDEVDSKIEASTENKCQNCGAALLGPYCHQCGQPQRSPIREFFGIVTDGSSQLLSLDGKLMQTLAMLLLRPGALVNRYLAGQRVQFVQPIKLYLSLSLTLFLLMGLASAIDSLQERGPIMPKTTPLLQVTNDDDVSVLTIGSTGVKFMHAEKLWHPEQNPLALRWLPNWGNRWLNHKLTEVDSASKQVHQDPSELIDKVLAVLPTTMFVLVPIFALLLKLLYVFSNRLYAEHLLVTVQAHSFLFLCLTIATLLRFVVFFWPAASNIASVGYGAIGLWVSVYLFLLQKRVYAQHWALTVLMYCLAGFAYLVLLVFALTFTVIGALASY